MTERPESASRFSRTDLVRKSDLNCLQRYHSSVVDCLVGIVPKGGLSLSPFQRACILTTGSRLTALSSVAERPIDGDEARSIFEVALSVAVFEYDPTTDLFTRYDAYPYIAPLIRRPYPQIPPGTGILAYVGRFRPAYRTPWIHSDLRTYESIEDVAAGAGDAIYLSFTNGQSPTVRIVVVSLRMSGIFDLLKPDPAIVLRGIAEANSLFNSPAEPRQPAAAIPFGEFGRSDELLDFLCHSADQSIVIATLWQAKRNNDGWQCRIQARDVRPDFIVQRLTRRLHLGTLLQSCNDTVHDNIARARKWYRQAADHWSSDDAPSKIAGLAAFESSMYRYQLWVAGEGLLPGLIRLNYSKRIERAQIVEQTASQLKFVLLRIASALEELNFSFSGTVALAHLRWDVQRSLLTRLNDHLLGITSLELDWFVTQVESLFNLNAIAQPSRGHRLGDVWQALSQTDTDLSPFFGCFADEQHGAIAGSAWLFRDLWRITSNGDGDDVYFCSSDTKGRFRQLSPAEDGDLVRFVRSRHYLGAIQELLTAVWKSRPGSVRLTWDIKNNGRVEVFGPGADACLEEVSVALPSLVFGQHVQIIMHPSGERCYTVHSAHLLDLTYDGIEKNLRARQFLDPPAVCIHWELCRQMPVILAASLPREGKSFQKHLKNAASEYLGHFPTEFQIHGAQPPEGFSINLSGKLMAHGKIICDLPQGAVDAQVQAQVQDFVLTAHKMSPSAVEFFLSLLNPEFLSTGNSVTSVIPAGQSPSGFKSLARQLHVLSVGPPHTNEHLYLNLYTAWELSGLSPDHVQLMVTKIRDAATHAAERLSIERPKPALVVPSQPHVEEQSLPCTVEQETVGPVFISHALDIPESLENFELLRRMVVERPRIPGRAGGILVPAVAGPFAGNTPRHGEYSVFLPDEIRNAQYVIHDYTFPTAGVVFETGLSIGYRRPFSFFWNESQIRFDEMLLPRCLRYINVVRLKSAKGNKEWFAELIDNPCRAIGSIECPFELWKTCTYNKKVPTRYVFVYCPSGRNLIERFLERYLRETCGVSVITGSSLKNERHWGCALLHHMYHAAYTIIDSGLSVSLNDRIAHAEEYANENEATLLLGIAAARNTRCLRIHAENRKTVSMWGSRPALSYTPDNYESVLGDGIRSLHLKWIEAFSD